MTDYCQIRTFDADHHPFPHHISMGLSLWIVPSPKDVALVERVMRVHQKDSSLSETTYPHFYPHITLASLPPEFGGNLDEVEAAIRESILNKKKVQTLFRSVEMGDHYFRSVYITIELTLELEMLQHEVHTALRLDKTSPLFPHLSLCYISDDDAVRGERKAFYDKLTTKGFIREFIRASGSSGVALGGTDQDGAMDEEIDGFDIHEIWLVQCEGRVEGWPVLLKIPV